MTVEVTSERTLEGRRKLVGKWSSDSKADLAALRRLVRSASVVILGPRNWPEDLSPFGQRLRTALGDEPRNMLYLAEALFPESPVRDRPGVWARMTGGHVRRFLSQLRRPSTPGA